jgi:hypothetical protein
MFRNFKSHGLLVVLLVSVLLSGCFGFGKSEPEITVTGIEDGQSYENPVTPVITPKSGTVIKEVKLNDAPFTSGSLIAVSGDYTLTIVAEHEKSKKTKTFEFTFVLSIDKPVIMVTGVEDGEIYYKPVTPVITTLDPNDIIEATLNDEDYVLGTPITEVGSYSLKITATNADSKTAELTIHFQIVASWVELTIGTDTTGFGAERGSRSINTDPNYVRTGERSVRFENQTGTKSALRINRPAHPDWPADWTPFDTLTFWIYIFDASKISSMELRLYTMSNPHDKGYPAAISPSDLEPGWNRLDFSFEALGIAADDLRNMQNDSTWIDLIIRSSTEVVTVYIDDIFLYASELIDPEDI